MADLIDVVSEQFEFMTAEDQFRRHYVPLHLWPSLWTSVCFDRVPQWRTVRFGYDATSSVPKERGVYAFRIRIASFAVPDNGVIAYFGSSSVLQDRYRGYLTKKGRNEKRPKVRKLFKNWGDELDFVYWVIEDNSCPLKPIEQSLNSAVMAPFVTDDFEAWARDIRPIL